MRLMRALSSCLLTSKSPHKGAAAVPKLQVRMAAIDPKRTSKDVRLSRSGHVQPVKRAERLADGMLHMRVDHGRLKISVTEQ